MSLGVCLFLLSTVYTKTDCEESYSFTISIEFLQPKVDVIV